MNKEATGHTKIEQVFNALSVEAGLTGNQLVTITGLGYKEVFRCLNRLCDKRDGRAVKKKLPGESYSKYFINPKWAPVRQSKPQSRSAVAQKIVVLKELSAVATNAQLIVLNKVVEDYENQLRKLRGE